MREDLLLAALASAAASLACVTPEVDPVPPPLSALDAEQRIDELEGENALLREQVDVLRTRLERAFRADGVHAIDCPVFPPIDAVVLDVNQKLGLVVLDKGKRDGVQIGYVFDVYLGSTYRGQVRVTDARERMSSGIILSEKSPIARGDSASTML